MHVREQHFIQCQSGKNFLALFNASAVEYTVKKNSAHLAHVFLVWKLISEFFILLNVPTINKIMIPVNNRAILMEKNCIKRNGLTVFKSLQVIFLHEKTKQHEQKKVWQIVKWDKILATPANNYWQSNKSKDIIDLIY